jgi:hypothetical protein
MNNFLKVKRGTVELKHHSASSVIEIVVSHNDGEKLLPESIMVNYRQWAELKEAMKVADEM